MVGKYLVTTALKETWPESHEIIFLGEWCKLFDDNLNNNFKNITIKYHWDDRIKLQRDYYFLEKIYEKLLLELVADLNRIHQKDYSVNYWRILIGPWLGYFIHIIYDRWFMINLASNEFDKLSTILLKLNETNLVPRDMNHFNELYISDKWNHYIYGKIIKNLNSFNILLKESIHDEGEINKENKLNQKIKLLYAKYVNIFSRKSDFLLINTYLSKFNLLKLHLKLKSIPVPNSSFPIKVKFVSKRKFFFDQLSKGITNETNFENLLRALIIDQIPNSYVESFNELAKMSKKLNWPYFPKTIFTSNSQNSDDIFKEYAARAVEVNQTKLIIGQHGGHYGIGAFNFNEEHEIKISHKYLSWGWTNTSPKVYPLGQLKIAKSIKRNSSISQNLLLVTATFPRYSYFIYSGIIASQWLYYFNDQCEFVNNLEEKIRGKSIIRLYKNDYNWGQVKRWKQEFPEILLSDGKKNISYDLKKCKLFVATYNATTYLESINLNIPTVIFWDINYWELNEFSYQYFIDLKKVGVFHDNPKSAAEHINCIWENVEEWWNSTEVIEAIENFKNNYNKKSNYLVESIVKIIKDK